MRDPFKCFHGGVIPPFTPTPSHAPIKITVAISALIHTQLNYVVIHRQKKLTPTDNGSFVGRLPRPQGTTPTRGQLDAGELRADAEAAVPPRLVRTADGDAAPAVLAAGHHGAAGVQCVP